MKTLLAIILLVGSASAQPSPVRKPAPAFQLKDASGKLVRLSDYQGKIVLLNFWATWCTGCKEELPWFADFERKYSTKGFSAIGVSMDEGGWPVVKPFLDKINIPFQMLLGDGATADRFEVEVLPLTLLIDRKGRIIQEFKGLVKRAKVEAAIKSALVAK